MSNRPRLDRRRILKALTAAGATIGLTNTATADGDDDDETTTSHDDKPDGCDCKTDKGYCPLNNTVFLAYDGAYGDEKVEYQIKVTGKIQLGDSGRRITDADGTLSADGTGRCRYKYSGEIECLEINGPAEVTIDQEFPCDPDE